MSKNINQLLGTSLTQNTSNAENDHLMVLIRMLYLLKILVYFRRQHLIIAIFLYPISCFGSFKINSYCNNENSFGIVNSYF